MIPEHRRQIRNVCAVIVGVSLGVAFYGLARTLSDLAGVDANIFGRIDDSALAPSGTMITFTSLVLGTHVGLLIGSDSYRNKRDGEPAHGGTPYRTIIGGAVRVSFYLLLSLVPLDLAIDPDDSWLSFIHGILAILILLVVLAFSLPKPYP